MTPSTTAGRLLAFTLGALAMAAQAADLPGDVHTLPGGTLWSTEQVLDMAPPPSERGPVPVADAQAASAVRGTVERSMLWAARGRWAVGLGVQQPSLSVSPAAGPDAQANTLGRRDEAVVLGLALATSASTRLTVQAPWPVRDLMGGDIAPEVRQARIGLSFQVADPYRELRRGSLMKVELASQTSLSLRPRKGRLALTLTRRW